MNWPKWPGTMTDGEFRCARALALGVQPPSPIRIVGDTMPRPGLPHDGFPIRGGNAQDRVVGR